MRYTIFLSLFLLQGCAVGLAIDGVSLVTTGKTPVDHMSSTLAQADCNTAHVIDGKYYCEQRDIALTYNRNPF